ncbi:MAG: AAA family ATPase [Methanomassiliicoccales archaeon]|nr:AAA family ATPase [Methanomassiliicoccales archaeon]
MSYTIAVAGKGGVGKSTIAALLIRALAEKSREIVLAVDADPNSNLGEKLGVKVDKTIGDLREDLLKKADEIPAGTSKQEFVRYQIQLALVEGDQFDLLTMGRPEGPGCYCYINNILRTFMDELIDDYAYIVIDNEAGMEHLSRRTTRKMDKLIVVSDATKLGIDTAVRIKKLAEEMKIEIKSNMLIINRSPMEFHGIVEAAINAGRFQEVRKVPNDKKIEELAMAGEPLTKLDSTSPAFRAIKEITRDIA